MCGLMLRIFQHFTRDVSVGCDLKQKGGTSVFPSRQAFPPVVINQTLTQKKEIYILFMSENTNNTPDKIYHFISFCDIYILMQVYRENRAIRNHILQQVWELTQTWHLITN